MGYLGGILPKAMIPVRGQPLVWHALRTLAEVGVTDATVAIRPGTYLLEDYLRGVNPRAVGLRAVRT